MKHKLAYYASGFLSIAALLFVSISCWGFSHRPETPEELLK
ncbi:cyclic lactone autoinducer peptide [Paenibacillus sp. y28]